MSDVNGVDRLDVPSGALLLPIKAAQLHSKSAPPDIGRQ
jgi:hypothetical protein